jgi:hypothetical protein
VGKNSVRDEIPFCAMSSSISRSRDDCSVSSTPNRRSVVSSSSGGKSTTSGRANMAGRAPVGNGLAFFRLFPLPNSASTINSSLLLFLVIPLSFGIVDSGFSFLTCRFGTLSPILLSPFLAFSLDSLMIFFIPGGGLPETSNWSMKSPTGSVLRSRYQMRCCISLLEHPVVSLVIGKELTCAPHQTKTL